MTNTRFVKTILFKPSKGFKNNIIFDYFFPDEWSINDALRAMLGVKNVLNRNFTNGFHCPLITDTIELNLTTAAFNKLDAMGNDKGDSIEELLQQWVLKGGYISHPLRVTGRSNEGRKEATIQLWTFITALGGMEIYVQQLSKMFGKELLSDPFIGDPSDVKIHWQIWGKRAFTYDAVSMPRQISHYKLSPERTINVIKVYKKPVTLAA